MLVTFHSRAYADITMFGTVAETLLKMMGHSGSVPGALLHDDIPAALARLQAALAALAQQQVVADETDEDRDDEIEEVQPPLSRRALPLLELLAASARVGSDVMWD